MGTTFLKFIEDAQKRFVIWYERDLVQWYLAQRHRIFGIEEEALEDEIRKVKKSLRRHARA